MVAKPKKFILKVLPNVTNYTLRIMYEQIYVYPRKSCYLEVLVRTEGKKITDLVEI